MWSVLIVAHWPSHLILQHCFENSVFPGFSHRGRLDMSLCIIPPGWWFWNAWTFIPLIVQLLGISVFSSYFITWMKRIFNPLMGQFGVEGYLTLFLSSSSIHLAVALHTGMQMSLAHCNKCPSVKADLCILKDGVLGSKIWAFCFVHIQIYESFLISYAMLSIQPPTYSVEAHIINTYKQLNISHWHT